MDDILKKSTELNRDPVLVLKGGKLCYLNNAARSLFPAAELGKSVSDLIPEEILSTPSESFCASVTVKREAYSFSALRSGDELLLSLAPIEPSPEVRGCLSDSLMNGMLSSLFNIGLSMERIHSSIDTSDPAVQEYLAILNHNYYALNRKLANLLYFCASSDSSVLIVRRNTDLSKLCADITDAVNAVTCPDRARVEYTCAANSVAASVDAVKIERLILNLLANSLLHTPADGRVRLRLSSTGSSAVISVDDNGCGIPLEKLNNIFCSYKNRLDERSLAAPSNGGLGLGICRSIAEKHGGTLILESRVGEGTSVRVTLPLAADGEVFRSERSEYECGGMSAILTELSDVLDTSAYDSKYSD